MGREDKEQVMDIGGVFTLVLIRGPRGYHGHYTNRVNGMTCSYDGVGMTKKQIVTKFWDRAKEFKNVSA